METPDRDEMNQILRGILEESKNNESAYYSQSDLNFINSMLLHSKAGTKGIFVLLHADNTFQYQIFGTDFAGAISVLALVIQRISKILKLS